jgi:ABC-type multidrug transport system fused ATPase/permease subunit
LLAGPKLLVLDAATSSVERTEAQIEAALGKPLSGRTSIVITHHLSTVRQDDRILVLGKRRVVEKGTPEELLSKLFI